MSRTALIVVDMQNDFLPGGALGVDGGFDIIYPIGDRIRYDRYDLIVATGDDHPEKTKHFERWAVHCVHGTKGAEIHPTVARWAEHTVLKGQSIVDDGFSGFEGFEVISRPATATVGVDGEFDLSDLLMVSRIDELTVVGLALDHCVKATAIDGVKHGYPTTVPLECTRAVSPDTGSAAIDEMIREGVVVTSENMQVRR